MNENKTKRKNTANFIAILILIAVTCVYFYFSFDLSEIYKAISDADFRVLAIGFSAVIIYLACYGMFAKTVLKFFGTKISLFRGLLYASTDFFYSSITPSATGGQPLVIYNMSKDGIPASQASFFTFFHTAVYKTVLIIFNIIALFYNLSQFREASIAFDLFWILGMIINLSMIFACLFSMFKHEATVKIASWVINFGAKLHIVKNPEERITAFSNSHEDYRASAKLVFKNPMLMLKLLLIVVIQRTAFFSIAYIVYRGMGLSGHTYMYFLTIQAIVAMAVDSLPLPGGIGANEAALVFTLESAYRTPDEAAAATLMIRLINFYFAVLISTVGTFTEQFLQRKRDKK